MAPAVWLQPVHPPQSSSASRFTAIAYGFRNSFGNLAIFAAILRASSLVGSLASLSALPPKADISWSGTNVGATASLLRPGAIVPMESARY